MNFLQGEWVVKRRNYAATLNNRGSLIGQVIFKNNLLFFKFTKTNSYE